MAHIYRYSISANTILPTLPSAFILTHNKDPFVCEGLWCLVVMWVYLCPPEIFYTIYVGYVWVYMVPCADHNSIKYLCATRISLYNSNDVLRQISLLHDREIDPLSRKIPKAFKPHTNMEKKTCVFEYAGSVRTPKAYWYDMKAMHSLSLFGPGMHMVL